MLSTGPARWLHFLRKSSKLAAARQEGRAVKVEWEDGVRGDFAVVWLRDCSPDPATYTLTPSMSARNLHMRQFDVEVEPLSVGVSDCGREMLVSWPGGVNSRFDSSWLRLRNACDEKERARRRQVYLFPRKTWGAEMKENLPRFDYDGVMHDDKALHDFLEAVCLHGLALVKGGPSSARVVEGIGRRIGLVQQTHFGRVFEVSTKADASNMAYATPSELPFHTDFPSLADPPQLQMLHMIRRAETGGNSLFVDGFHVAEQLRREQPAVFSLLTSMTAEYIEEGSDIHEGKDGAPQSFSYNMAARHKIIKVDDADRVVQIQFGNAMRSWFYDCDDVDRIQKYYRAMKIFTDYCYQERNVLKFPLENGDTVLWANTRLLHTRDSYTDSADGRRTLSGCYFAWDFVKSRVRQLRRTLSLPESQPSA